MITTETIDHNLSIPDELIELVGSHQIQINVFDDGKPIDTMFVDTHEEAITKIEALTP